VSPFLWLTAVVMVVMVGLLALAGALGRAAKGGVDELANPRFTTMDFAELPDWVRRRLTGLRDQFIALGFTELTCYRRHSPRLNYTCLFVSPDGLTLASAWIARARGLMLWLVVPAFGWSAFKNELLALPRFGLTTHFPDARMIETTPTELPAKSHVAGELEFVIVPPTMPLAAIRERHEAAAQEFARRCGAGPVSITTVEQFLASERAMIIRMAERLRRKIAG